MIRQAVKQDLQQIMEIVKRAIEIMDGEGNPQWDASYPAEMDFQADIDEGTLYVAEEDGRILGMVCVNCREPEEYAPLSWRLQAPCTVVHRMAVLPESRGRGLARAMLSHAEEIARKNGTYYLRSDTYGSNQKMNALLQRLGYVQRGQMFFKGKNGKFNCYDKILER